MCMSAALPCLAQYRGAMQPKPSMAPGGMDFAQCAFRPHKTRGSSAPHAVKLVERCGRHAGQHNRLACETRRNGDHAGRGAPLSKTLRALRPCSQALAAVASSKATRQDPEPTPIFASGRPSSGIRLADKARRLPGTRPGLEAGQPQRSAEMDAGGPAGCYDGAANAFKSRAQGWPSRDRMAKPP